METALQIVTATGALATTAMFAFVGVQLRTIRDELRRARLSHEPHASGSSARLDAAPLPAGHAIYVYRNAQWELEADFSKPGFEPSPPSMPGAYEGQAIKKQSVTRGT